MVNQIEFKKLSADQSTDMLVLIKQLNPTIDMSILKQRLMEMLKSEAYQSFGIYHKTSLIGLLGCWTFTKLYSGKQLELDNVIIDTKLQSKGYGKALVNFIEAWAIENDYASIGLNTYVENDRSHKFYFNQEYKILGFHFQKLLITN